MTDFSASVIQGNHSCTSILTEKYLENYNTDSHLRNYPEFSSLSICKWKKNTLLWSRVSVPHNLISSVIILRCGRERRHSREVGGRSVQACGGRTVVSDISGKLGAVLSYISSPCELHPAARWPFGRYPVNEHSSKQWF